MDQADLLRLSPFVYHATRRENLALIRDERRLLCPTAVYQTKGRTPPSSLRKSGKGSGRILVPFGDGHLRLGDHDRLREKHIRWEPGWNLSRFIELLNGLVFFWPGTPDGPSDAGLDHKRRYDNEGQPMVVLRASLVDLVAINGFPLVSACNSGAPRSNPRSGKQPRGADTFRSIDSLGAGERVVEVVFENQVVLPDSTERADSYGTGWRGLLAALS